MNDFGRRVNSIVVKNLPTNITENELEELFSKFGRILSSKVLPTNPNFDGSCGFVNFAEGESCNKAVENMNNFPIDRFVLRVQHSNTRMSSTNNFDRSQNGTRTNGETTNENNTITSPSTTQARFSGFRPASSRSSTCTTPSKTTEPEKPIWNSTNIEQQKFKSPFQNESNLTIREHDSFVTNQTYCVYLSNLEVPNIIFAATLDDYVNATLLITQMNKHEQLVKVQADTLKLKLTVGQFCAALFNGDWYRARILEVEESRVRVQYIDWGNAGWCESILEIRPLPTEFYKDPVLCVKCLLDGISTDEKLSDEQTNGILEILVLDVKLEMTVLRIENQTPYVQLQLGERNLNKEIRALISPLSSQTQSKLLTFDSNRPEVNPSEIHFVQLTTVDSESECFHVLLMRDCLPTIMNVLKDWNVDKQPLEDSPRENTLVCAQYEGDDLWYRAWIKTITDKSFRVYFVDFGNEEVVSLNRLSECPDELRIFPWQSIQIQLGNIHLTDDERYSLLHKYENERLEMNVLSQKQNLYLVDLLQNGKSLTDYIFDLRKKNEPKTIVEKENKPSIPLKTESIPMTVNSSDIRSAQSAFSELKRSVETAPPPPPPPQPAKPTNTSDIVTKSLVVNEQKSDNNALNENLTAMITEQRRQNRLIEQVIAAVNTTNALLTQLVQR